MDEPGLTAVKVAGARFRRAQRRRDEAMEELAEAVRAAVADSVPTRRVAEAAGVTRMTLDAMFER
jgi:DNA invertase Pin-like site-specific DNA recombinase